MKVSDYTGKTVLSIHENDALNDEPCVSIYFTDGTKISIVGNHPYDSVSLDIIEGEWNNPHSEIITDTQGKEIL